jgi:hypothetical protein
MIVSALILCHPHNLFVQSGQGPCHTDTISLTKKTTQLIQSIIVFTRQAGRNFWDSFLLIDEAQLVTHPNTFLSRWGTYTYARMHEQMTPFGFSLLKNKPK